MSERAASTMRLSAELAAHAVLAASLLPAAALAYGPEGHLIAGRAAASHLCRAAVAEVGRLAGGDGLDELGLWADRVRREPRYEQSAPWHYMNIADGLEITRYESPPEGDVLTALERYHGVLAAGGGASDEDREEALLFLVHFVVDVHQPLHVGRADDRGGNSIDVIVGGERVNVHRFWDTEAITTGGDGVVVYSRAIAEAIEPGQLAAPFEPRVWAAESLALRDTVYAFEGDGAVLDAAYLQTARDVTRERLTLAAARLAGTLNALFCR